VSVCLYVRGRMPTLLHGPGCNLGNGMGCPLFVHCWADLQSVHGLRCYGNTRNAWQSPAVIRHAHRTPHALHMPAKTPLASDKIDAPAARAVPFHPYCGGIVTRTRNVSEYMLVLALCLVSLFMAIYWVRKVFSMDTLLLIPSCGTWMLLNVIGDTELSLLTYLLKLNRLEVIF